MVLVGASQIYSHETIEYTKICKKDFISMIVKKNKDKAIYIFYSKNRNQRSQALVEFENKKDLKIVQK
ncbi:42909_t:CDS:2 [Gigaspora margarita]|uniref:42909_t:CDS:1 n=1 Tax=Gigaspora margarita TaxID=4874 RepID=A0ABN7V189_GIGMA|nr:42909_t:CDS:2 [Gigaspora margarita]